MTRLSSVAALGTEGDWGEGGSVCGWGEGRLEILLGNYLVCNPTP